MQAPRLQPIPLPHETYPFSIHASLSTHTTSFTIDLSSIPLRAHDLSPDDACRPATNPPISHLRIVHPSLTESILVTPSCPTPSSSSSAAYSSAPYITVSDVLTAIHTVLSRPLRQTEIPAHRRADVLSYFQATHSRPATYGVHGMGGTRVMRVVDLLEGSTMFRGLEMNVAQSNRLLGVIDGMQALTWILVTSEPGAATGVATYPHASPHITAYNTPHTTAYSTPYTTAYAPLTPVSLGHASPAAVYTYMPSNYGGLSTPQQQHQQHSALYLAPGSMRY